MHRLLRYLQPIVLQRITVFFNTARSAQSGYPPQPEITADAAILIDASTGQATQLSGLYLSQPLCEFDPLLPRCLAR